MSKKNKITTNTSIPIYNYEDSKTVGPRGPILLEDFFLLEKLATFNRERIPERVVHAKGTGVYGVFTVTNDISKYSRAKIFSEIGKKTKVFARFSLVAPERGGADTERDPRGFAIKHYTEDGIWDLVGNNTPIFFVKDPRKFTDFIHTQKRDPKTNCNSATMKWDFWSLNPESLHQVLILMSDRGTPYGYRHMHGYGSHTFSMLNAENEMVYVKFHYRCQQPIKNFSHEDAIKMKSENKDFAQQDMVEAIERKEFPKFKLYIQVMTLQQAKEFEFNPFDLTKTWSQKKYPLIEVGEMELNEIPENYFQDVEQSTFSPANIVDGIGFSPDKMLQGRIFAYSDAARYRVGVNHDSLPVNKCPFHSFNYNRDGFMRFDGNYGSQVNYFPNSFDNVEPDPAYKPIYEKLYSNISGFFDRNEDDNDHYTQPGILFEKVMDESAKQATIHNIIEEMKGIDGIKKEEITIRQLKLWYQCSKRLGEEVAAGLNIPLYKIIG